MDKNLFLKEYFKKLEKLINFSDEEIKKIITVGEIIKEAYKNNKKTLIFGNGGSAAITSHFSVDLTKNADRCTNYNSPICLRVSLTIMVMISVD